MLLIFDIEEYIQPDCGISEYYATRACDWDENGLFIGDNFNRTVGESPYQAVAKLCDKLFQDEASSNLECEAPDVIKD